MKKLRKLIAICMLLLLLVLLPSCASPEKSGTPPKQVQTTPFEWTPIYNDHEHGLFASRALPEGAFKEELTDVEIASIVPDELLVNMSSSGVVYFLEDGSIDHLVIWLKSSEEVITVCCGADISWTACCLSLEQDAKKSVCGEAEYALYQYDRISTMGIIATGELNGVPILVRMHADNEAEDKLLFEKVLERFARFRYDSLTISGVKPG